MRPIAARRVDAKVVVSVAADKALADTFPMNKQKTASLIAAILTTLVGLVPVVSPLVPDEWKGVVVVAVGSINYLLLSPVAKWFGLPSEESPQHPQGPSNAS